MLTNELNDNIYVNNIPYNKDSIQYDILSKNEIGNRKERSIYDSFIRLNKLNYVDNTTYLLKTALIYEIKRLLSSLKLEYNHYLIEKAYKFYKQANKNSRIYRNYEVIASITIYIHYTMNYIYVNKKKLLQVSKCSIKHFNKGLYHILLNNKQILVKLNNDDFRLKYIRNILIGMKNNFNYPNSFIKKSFLILQKIFPIIKNERNTTIIAKIIVLTKESIIEMRYCYLNKITEYLNISKGALYHPNTKKLHKIIERFDKK